LAWKSPSPDALASPLVRVRLRGTEARAGREIAPSAVLNEVAAVTRRLIAGLLEGGSGTIVPDPIAKALQLARVVSRPAAVPKVMNPALWGPQGQIRRFVDSRWPFYQSW
jgi:hypothetical protein